MNGEHSSFLPLRREKTQNKTFTTQIRMHQSRLERGSDSALGLPKPSYSPPADKTWLFLSATFLQSYSPRAAQTSALTPQPPASVPCSRNVATVENNKCTVSRTRRAAAAFHPRTSLSRTASGETSWNLAVLQELVSCYG